jgi:glycosyltransferase involved in cell wall biosynthesis
VIIPTRPGQADVPSVEAARRLDYPRELLEIIVVRGRQPAVQRNAALCEARGAWIYFLDDDARPHPANLRRALASLKTPAVKLIGGPNLCPSDAPPLEQLFAVVLSAWLAFGPSRARYWPVGGVRPSGEKELILCNLLGERAALLEAGGFDEALYPNEENALMDELQRRGGVLVYDPGFVVERRPRPTLRAFARMVFTYGRGRAEQFRLHPTAGSIANFVPPIFVLYLVLIPAIARTAGARFALAPLGFYAAAVAGQGIWSSVEHGLGRGIASLPLVVLTHVGYGIGFLRGLFTCLTGPQGKPRTEVVLERVAVGD